MTEPCTIVFITAGTSPARTEYAVRTIESVRQNLRYPELCWFVADDGSAKEHLDQVMGSLSGCDIAGVWSEHDSYGRSANEGIIASRERGQLLFFLEDDWELREPLDIWPYAALLMENKDTGMVRMGYLSDNLTATTFGHRGQLYWRLDNENPYAFAGHPSLRHIRFHDICGGYPEHLQPGETELGMAWLWKSTPQARPEIVWPALLGQHGPFGHIGTEQSYTWNGGHALK